MQSFLYQKSFSSLVDLEKRAGAVKIDLCGIFAAATILLLCASEPTCKPYRSKAKCETISLFPANHSNVATIQEINKAPLN